MTSSRNNDRRHFLIALGASIAAMAVSITPRLRAEGRIHHHDGSCQGHGEPGPHPEPRKGYKPEKILKAEDLDGDEELIALFNSVRENSTVIDGIRCHCGCAGAEGMYSLLSCYEGDNMMKGMATWCPICQGQGRLTIRLAKQGKTLEEIRKAIDVRF